MDFAAKVPKESIIEVKAKIAIPGEPIKACT